MSNKAFIGKNVVITGASGGLGAALCSQYAALGAHIIAIDRDEHGLRNLEAKLRANGAQITSLVCDLSDHEQVEAVLRERMDSFHHIDVLIHNAGITHRSSFRTTNYSVIKKVIDVNLIASILLTKILLESLIRAQGQIIVISSVAGIAPLIARTGYASSKHGLHGFYESLRTEIEPLGVHVMLVCPTFIQTGIEKNAMNEKGEPSNHAQVRIGKWYTPQEIATVIVRAAGKRKRILLIGKIAKTAYIISRLLPNVYSKIMVSRFRKELQEDGKN